MLCCGDDAQLEIVRTTAEGNDDRRKLDRLGSRSDHGQDFSPLSHYCGGPFRRSHSV